MIIDRIEFGEPDGNGCVNAHTVFQRTGFSQFRMFIGRIKRKDGKWEVVEWKDHVTCNVRDWRDADLKNLIFHITRYYDYSRRQN